MEENEDCSICYEKITKKSSLHCAHSFCKLCILRWAEIENTCPICRKEFEKIQTLKKEIKIKSKTQSVLQELDNIDLYDIINIEIDNIIEQIFFIYNDNEFLRQLLFS